MAPQSEAAGGARPAAQPVRPAQRGRRASQHTAAVLVGLVALHVALALLVFVPSPHTGGDNAGYISLAWSLLTEPAYLELYDPATPPHTQSPPVFPAVLAAAMLAGIQALVGLKAGHRRLFGRCHRADFPLAAPPRFPRGRALGRAAHGRGARRARAEPLGALGRAVLDVHPACALGFRATASGRTRAVRPGVGGCHARLLHPLGRAAPGRGRRRLASAAPPLAPARRSRRRPAAARAGVVAARAGVRRRGLPRPVHGRQPVRPGAGPHRAGRPVGPHRRERPPLPARAPADPSAGPGGAAHVRAQRVDRPAGSGRLGRAAASPGRRGAVPAAVRWAAAPLAGRLGGERFLLPVFPLILANAGEALTHIGRRIGARAARSLAPAAAGVLLLAGLPALYLAAREGTACTRLHLAGEPYLCLPEEWRDFFELAEWSLHGLPDGAVVLSRKPRLFFMLSGHRGRVYPLSPEPAVFFRAVRESGARYLLLDHVDGLSAAYLTPVLLVAPDAFCAMRSLGISRTALLGIDAARWDPDSPRREPMPAEGGGPLVQFRLCPEAFRRVRA